MKLIEVSYKNIMCYGDKVHTVRFDGVPGITHITGNNGHGKSTILKVIKLGLYNEPGRNVHLKDIANETKGNGWIRVEMVSKGKHCIVETGFSPNFIVLTVDGENITDKFSGANEIKKYIREELVDVPYHIFDNILSVSMDDFVSFLKLKAEDARNIRDRMFGLTELNKVNAKLKEDVSVEQANLKSLKSKIDTLKDVIKNGKKKLEEERVRTDDDVKREIAELQERFNAAEKELQEIEEDIKVKNKAATYLQQELKTATDNKEHKKAHQTLSDLIKSSLPDTMGSLTTANERMVNILETSKKIDGAYEKVIGNIARVGARQASAESALRLYDEGTCPECGADLTDGDHVHKKKMLLGRLEAAKAEYSKAQDARKKIKASKDKVASKKTEVENIISAAKKYMNDYWVTLNNCGHGVRFGRIDLNTIISANRGFFKSDNPQQSHFSNFVSDLEGWLSEYTASDVDKAEIDKMDAEYNTITEEIFSLNSKLKEVSESRRSAETNLNIKKGILESLSGKAARIEAMEAMIKDNEEALEIAKEKYASQEEIVRSYAAARRATNEVKPRIIASSIPTLNKLLNDNLNKYGLPLQVTFNDDFTTVVKRNGKVINHNTISPGQKKMVDFSIIAANVKLILMQYSDINFIFLDEIFSSLSRENVATMSEACRTFCDDMGLHTMVISHHYLSEEIIDKFIKVKFENGFSTFEIANTLSK